MEAQIIRNEEKTQATLEPIFGIANPLVLSLHGNLLVANVSMDVDGTINDETLIESERLSTIGPAQQAIADLQSIGIAVGITTARSFGEAQVYQEAVGATGMIIPEDGAIVVLPEGITSEMVSLLSEKYRIVEHNDRKVILVSSITSGKIEEFLYRFMQSLELEEGQEVITSFNDIEKVRSHIHHPTREDAERSTDRLASGYVYGLTPDQRSNLVVEAEACGMRTFGELLHIVGKDADKGAALAVVNDIVRMLYPQFSGIFPIGIGNNTNDLLMYENARNICGDGLAFLVAKPDSRRSALVYPEGGQPAYAILDRSQIPDFVRLMPRPYGYGVQDAVNEIKRILQI